MIVLYNPKATRYRNRRFPLSVLSIAAVLEGREDYVIVDGNLDPHPIETLDGIFRDNQVELLAVTVMPGPQTVTAVQGSRAVRERYPRVPIAWGGYFASNYTEAALNAPYVDFAVRGQGEDTLLELLDALRGRCNLRDSRPVVQRRGRRAPAQCRASHAAARHISLVSLPSHPGGEISPADFSRPADRRPPGEHRMPLPLQLLRRRHFFGQPPEAGSAGAYGGGSRPPREDLRRRRGPVL